MVSHWNLNNVSTEEVPDFISAYLNRPTANSTEHSSRERPRTSDNQHYRHMQDNLHQYQCITSKQAGQIHTLILTELDLLISLGIVTGIGIIHILHIKLNICITKLGTLINITATCHIMQMVCTP